MMDRQLDTIVFWQFCAYVLCSGNSSRNMAGVELGLPVGWECEDTFRKWISMST